MITSTFLLASLHLYSAKSIFIYIIHKIGLLKYLNTFILFMVIIFSNREGIDEDPQFCSPMSHYVLNEGLS